MPTPTDPQQLLAFDFGTRRIGIASGHTLSQSSTELKPIRATDGIPDWNALDGVVQEWSPDALIVGLPLNMDGTISEIARRARKFANRLNARYQLPVYLQDERLSTAEAKEIHHARGGGNHYKSESVDGIAARLIVESWLAEPTFIDSQTPLEQLYDLPIQH